MVKEKRKRELEAPGKGSQFILHGEEVPQSKITRFEERMQRSSKINEEDTLSDVGRHNQFSILGMGACS